MAEQEDQPMDTAAKGFQTASVSGDVIKLRASFTTTPLVTENRCPWCGGLDGIVGNRCQMPGCGRPVIYKGPRPVDEPALTPQEIEILASQKAEQMEKVMGLGPLPGNIRSMRSEMRRRQSLIDAEKKPPAPEQKPGPRARRPPPIAIPEGKPNTFGDF